MRYILALVTIALAVTAPSLARAESKPGDACSPNNSVTHSGGVEEAGNAYWLVCKTGTWTSIISTDANGMASTNTPTAPNHIATKAYVDASGGNCGPCDGTPTIFSFPTRPKVDFNPAIPIESAIRAVDGIDCPSEITVSGTGSPEYRICNDSTCSSVDVSWTTAANDIDLGQFIQMRLTPPGTRNQSVTGTVTFEGYYKASFTTTTRDYYRIFATDSTYNGNLGGLAGADTICTSEKTAGGLTGTYKAWLSTSTINAKSRVTQASVPYANAFPAENAPLLANNFTDLIDGAINTNTKTRSGGAPSGTYVWTNTQNNGDRWETVTANVCSNWTSTGATGGAVGLVDNNNQYWSSYATGYSCASQYHLYCFEQ